MSRGLMAMPPLMCNSNNEVILLVLKGRAAYSWIIRIMDGSGCKHSPAIMFAQSPLWSINLNISLSTWELHGISYAKFCWVDMTSGHILWPTDTAEIYQSVLSCQEAARKNKQTSSACVTSFMSLELMPLCTCTSKHIELHKKMCVHALVCKLGLSSAWCSPDLQ